MESVDSIKYNENLLELNSMDLVDTPSNVEHILFMSFIKRMGNREISRELGIYHSYVNRVVKKYTDIIVKNLQKKVSNLS